MGEVRVADEDGLKRRTPAANRDRAHQTERLEIGTPDEKNAFNTDTTIEQAHALVKGVAPASAVIGGRRPEGTGPERRSMVARARQAR